MKFFSMGISHRQAPAEVRDTVVFAGGARERFLAAMHSAGIDQLAVLATCNRVEAFFFAESPDSAKAVFLGEYPAAAGALRVREGREAFVYLCRIAAGFESMVFGEYQILGQVKEAYAEAREAGFVGGELDRVLRDAISAAKRVRTELDLGAVPPSVCRAGMDAVGRICGISGKRFFIIGSGRTGSLAARIAKERGASSITVCNRSPERTRRLVETLGAATVDYAERCKAIEAADIVVSATASPHVVVKAEDISLSRKTVFLDLASPRDVDPALAENPLATIVSIDTIGELAAGDRDERERLSANGMGIIQAAADSTGAWLAGRDVSRRRTA